MLKLTAGDKSATFDGKNCVWDATAWLNNEVDLEPDAQAKFDEWMNTQGQSVGSTYAAKRDMFALAVLGWYVNNGHIDVECAQVFTVGPAHSGDEPEALLEGKATRDGDDRWFLPGTMVVWKDKPYIDVRKKIVDTRVDVHATSRVIGDLWALAPETGADRVAALDAANDLGGVNERELVIVEGAMSGKRIPAWCWTIASAEQVEGAERIQAGSWKSYLRNKLRHQGGAGE